MVQLVKVETGNNKTVIEFTWNQGGGDGQVTVHIDITDGHTSGLGD